MDTEAVEDETPKDLRGKLEAANRRIKELDEQYGKLLIKEVLTTNKFGLVSEDDLKGVGLSEVEARAAKLQEERQASERRVAEAFYAKQGLEGEELTKAVEAHFTGEQSEPADAAAQRRAEASTSAGAAPIKGAAPIRGFEAVFSQNKKSQF